MALPLKLIRRPRGAPHTLLTTASDHGTESLPPSVSPACRYWKDPQTTSVGGTSDSGRHLWERQPGRRSGPHSVTVVSASTGPTSHHGTSLPGVSLSLVTTPSLALPVSGFSSRVQVSMFRARHI